MQQVFLDYTAYTRLHLGRVISPLLDSGSLLSTSSPPTVTTASRKLPFAPVTSKLGSKTTVDHQDLAGDKGRLR